MPVPKDKDGLTVRQKKLVRGIAEGKTKRQAGIDAGYTGKPETVSTVVSETLSKPYVQDALQREMEKQGITLEQIVAPVKKALKATHVIKTADGQVVDTGTDDLEMQLKGHDRAVRMFQIANKQEEQKGNTFNFNFKGGAAFDMGKYKK